MPRQNASPDERAVQGSEPIVDLPIGNVDIMTADELVGWAWDPDLPDEPITVEILDADKSIVSIDADIYRPDLETAGFGNGRHGFAVLQIGHLLPNIYHRLRVRRKKDQRELPGSPKWITNLDGGLEDRGVNLVDHLTTAAVLTADKPEDLEDILSLFVACARRLLQKQKSLLGRAAPATLQAIREQYPDLPLAASATPTVTVIIPVYNNFRLTYECLASIAANPPETPCELLLVDDGSTDETVLAGLLLPDSVLVERLRSNSGFIAACNRGAHLAKGEFLLFLNNDTLVQPGWLDEMVRTFERTENVGIVGSQLLSVDGKVQEVGGIVWRLGDAWNWGRGADPSDPRLRYLRDVDYVSGAALMIRKELFLSLGGFDPRYAPAYYEDTDLAFRVREAGKRVVVQPASRIIHLEGATGGKNPAASAVKRHQTLNQTKFYQRWRSVLLRHRMNGEEPDQEAERSVTRRAYFIDDCVPKPDFDAGSNAALQHMLALIALGYKVTFLPADNMARDEPYTNELEKLGIECPHWPVYWSVEHLFRDQRPPPDLIYIHRLANAEKYASMSRVYFPDSGIIYSVADLHFLRLEREAALTGGRNINFQAEQTKGRELSVMEHVDVVLVHSPYEADLIKRLAPATKVKVLGWAVPLRELKTPIDRRSGMAFVGGYQHRPNVDAAIHLAHEIMPLIRTAGLPIRCYIAGSKMPQEVVGLDEPDVEIVGFVPDLTSLFDKVRCTVAPLRYGAGVKGKVLDSLAFGLPCVMTEVAAEGLDLTAELAWLVSKSSDEFVHKVIALHREPELAMRLRDAGQAFIRDRFGSDVIRNGLRQIITSINQSKPAGLYAP
jgi:O-antigen biosynthesis protein